MLKISTRSRYGLRAMIALAEAYERGPLEMRAIAEQQQFSRKYLHNLFTQLRQAGLIVSVRGAAGGFALERSPEQISVADIVTAVDGPVRIIDCIDSPCALKADCRSVSVWQRVNYAVLHVLQDTTLADLLVDNWEDLR